MTDRSAIGGTSQIGDPTNPQKFNYNTPAVQLGNTVRDGDEFVLFTRGRQGEGYRMWSSSDHTATPEILKQAMTQLDLNPVTA